MISSDNYQVLEKARRRARRDCMRRHDDLLGLIDLLWHLFIAPLWSEFADLRVRINPEALSGGEDTAEEHCRRHTMALLARLGGNKMRAARELKINTKTLYNWLKRWEEQARRRAGA